MKVLKTILWPLVNIKVLGIETENAGKRWGAWASEDDISKYLNSVGYNKTKTIGDDIFFVRN